MSLLTTMLSTPAQTFDGAVTISGAATLKSTLTVSGAAVFKTTATFEGAAVAKVAFTAEDKSTFSGAAVFKTTATFEGAAVAKTTLGIDGITTPTGGIAAAGGFSASPRNIHTGGITVTQTTDGNDTQPSVTETYICEVIVPYNCTVTGIALFNGSATGSGSVTVTLANSAGVPVATQSASTAISGTDAFQRIPLGATYSAVGPATYLVLVQYNNTATRFNTHLLGNFGASKKTGETYGTFTTVTPPTTFTANQGPIASLY